jgi:hypothetical protein
VALAEVGVLVAALLLLGEEPQPAKVSDVATTAIAAPVIAVRFIALAPVDLALHGTNPALSRHSLDCGAV